MTTLLKMKFPWPVLLCLVSTSSCKKGQEAAAPADPPEEAVKKDEVKKESPPSDSGTTPAATTDTPAGDPPKVRPPTKEDLAAYTKDLPGSGPLMAAIHTSAGVFNCELLAEVAPVTVANFVGLSRGMHAWRNPSTREVETKPLYNGTIFHRIIPDFMIQGGDPLGLGSGGPDYRFADETSPTAKHDKGGTLSMANSGPATNGSQFFITERPTPHLDGRHTVFGYCKEIDLVKKITSLPRNARDKPNTDVVIEKIEITRGPAK
jgi:peptidyl-prolyl cis-trans isomerase A (cyclophilin A)